MSRFEEVEIADRLPSPAGLCLALLSLAHERRESRKSLVESIRADPALTGRLISLVNGSRGEDDSPVLSVRAAAAHLEPDAIRGVALTFSLPTSLPDALRESFDLRAFWIGSLAAASSAESIARRFGTMDPDEAYTLGLLCRVGMLAMAAVHPAEFAGILAACPGRLPGALEAAESQALQIDHWQAGAELMESWGFPGSFTAPILAQSPAGAGSAVLELRPTTSHSLLTLALRMADEILAGEAQATKGPLTASEAALRSARSDAEHQLEELAAFVGLQDPQASDCRRIASAAKSAEEIGVDPPSEAKRIPGAAEPASLATRPVPPTRILVVDDEPGARHLLGIHLRRAGYDVISAPDGRAGLAMAISDAPQMVITDWVMPGMSGPELCTSLRQTEAGRRMYLVVLTSREEEDNVVAGLEAGANDYLTKPFNPRILLARVQAGERVIALQRQVEIDKLTDRRRVAQMAQLTRRLRAVSLMDALTGLYNRRYAMNALQDAWNASERYNRTVSVVMVDIDHFKRVNDEHGHQAGDTVLRATADVLRASCRRSDTVCRLGGEEFLVINANGSLEEALACAGRLRAAVEANQVVADSFDDHVTISLGVAERTPEMNSIDDLLAASDLAVYAAKSQGRNRVCSSQPPSDLRDSA